MTQEPPRGPAAPLPGSPTDTETPDRLNSGGFNNDSLIDDGLVDDDDALHGSDHLSAGLTARQDAFCRAYVLDPNGTCAAVKAGYAPSSAHAEASRTLKKVKVQDRIRDLRAVIAERHCLDAASLMGKLEAVFHRAYENYQMQACVRTIALQAQLAGTLLAKRDNSYPVIDITPARSGNEIPSLKLMPVSGPSTQAGDAATLKKD